MCADCTASAPSSVCRITCHADTALRPTIHAVVSTSEGGYVAECLEVAVVTQGESLDETLHNLREAIGLFLADEDPAELGLVTNPRLAVSFETTVS